MIDYKQAHTIRREYSEKLSRQDINNIIERWLIESVGEVGMLGFSVLYDMHNDTRDLSELELYLRATTEFYLQNLNEEGGITNGMLMATYVGLITDYRDALSVEPETYDLRLQIAEETLDKMKRMNAVQLSRGLAIMKRLKLKVIASMKELYGYNMIPNDYQKRVDALQELYIMKADKVVS